MAINKLLYYKPDIHVLPPVFFIKVCGIIIKLVVKDRYDTDVSIFRR